MKTINRFTSGFTIVELTVVIAVLGIIAGVVTAGIGSWQTSVAQKAVQSDLKLAAAAMENAKNFGSGYPGAIPASFTPSSNVTLTYYSSSASNFCINAIYTSKPQVRYYLDTTKGKEPRAGTCATGDDAPGGGGGGSTPAPTPVALSNLDAGAYQTCAIGGGKPYCWGYNSSGEVGNGTTTHVPVPTAVNTSGVMADKTTVQVSAGQWHTCALTSDNKIFCWGFNNSGQLGNGTTTNSSVPVAVNMSGAMAGKTVSSISAGSMYTCARVTDGNAYCWGTGSSGVRGDSSYANALNPVQVPLTGVFAGKTIKQIAAGENTTCAIASDDKAYCWGYSYYGEMGNGNGGNGYAEQLTPVAVSTSGVLSGKILTKISVGVNNVCTVATDGKAYCWGFGANGLLGNGTTAVSYVPVAVTSTGVLSGVTLTDVSVGEMAVCAYGTNGRGYCWGVGVRGERGDGSSAQSNVPTAVSTSGVLSGKTLTSVSEGYWHGCANATDGNVYCWGYNSESELGNNSTTNSLVPVLSISPTN